MNKNELKDIIINYYEKNSKEKPSNIDEIYNYIMDVDSLIKDKDFLIIGIDGNSAAGKSSFSEILEKIYDCNVFHMDDFFLRPEQKTEERLKEVGGNVDYERFNKEVIMNLKKQGEFHYQIYSCASEKMEKTVKVTPKKINIVEGAYSMHPTLIHNYDLKIFFQIDKLDQSRRILNRNGLAMHKNFIKIWIPLESQYIEKYKIKEKADIVIKI